MGTSAHTRSENAGWSYSVSKNSTAFWARSLCRPSQALGVCNTNCCIDCLWLMPHDTSTSWSEGCPRRGYVVAVGALFFLTSSSLLTVGLRFCFLVKHNSFGTSKVSTAVLRFLLPGMFLIASKSTPAQARRSLSAARMQYGAVCMFVGLGVACS